MDSVRTRIAEFIGFRPCESASPLETLNRHESDGCSRSLVRYTSGAERVEAYLFEPLHRPSCGGVLALHQHNSQWTLGKSEVAGLVGDPLQAFGPHLARRGFTVLAPDSVGFETRMGVSAGPTSLAPPLLKPGTSPDHWLQYYNQMAYRLVRGDLLMRTMLQDASLAFSVLRQLVPAGSLTGVVGHSMGGNIALFLAALDTRVDMTCVSGAVSSYRAKIARGIGLEMALIIPGFANAFDVDYLLRCIAPRRLLVVSADNDFASVDAVDLVRRAQSAFDGADAGERLSHRHSAGEHALDPARFDAIVDWFGTQCAGD
jgi:dienelactone hydrolase